MGILKELFAGPQETYNYIGQDGDREYVIINENFYRYVNPANIIYNNYKVFNRSIRNWFVRAKKKIESAPEFKAYAQEGYSLSELHVMTVGFTSEWRGPIKDPKYEEYYNAGSRDVIYRAVFKNKNGDTLISDWIYFTTFYLPQNASIRGPREVAKSLAKARSKRDGLFESLKKQNAIRCGK
jgi:hypothetical protein